MIPVSQYLIHLRDLGGAQPADVRLRQALKVLRRAFGFECRSIGDVDSFVDAGDAGGSSSNPLGDRYGVRGEPTELGSNGPQSRR